MADSQVAGRIPHTTPEPPPTGLSDTASKLWTDTLARYEFRPTELALLESALRSLDRAEAARAEVEAEGLTVTTQKTGAVRAHPSIRTEAEARREFRMTWRVLGLVDPHGPGGGR